MMPFITKYSPKKISDIVNQDAGVKELENFILNFNKQKKRAALVYGHSGTGKTSSVYAIGREHGMEVVEVNASEFRNQEQINMKIGNAIRQRSLFSKEKLILIDEVDGIAGREDRGGLQAILKLMEETPYPMILTLNDPYDNKFSSLRSKCILVKFEPLNYIDISKFLKKVCHHENISADDELLRTLARRAGGNMMAALNDLESIASKSGIGKLEIDNIGHRDIQESILNALLRIFKTTDINVALGAFENVKENLDEQFLWLDENLPKEYTKSVDIANAYDAFSRALVFNKRILRNQYYRFLVYINALITAGIAVSKSERYQKQVEYTQTKRLLKIFWANQKSLKKKAIAKKIAQKTHCSVKDAFKNMYYYQIIFRNSKEMALRITTELELDSAEAEWLRK